RDLRMVQTPKTDCAPRLAVWSLRLTANRGAEPGATRTVLTVHCTSPASRAEFATAVAFVPSYLKGSPFGRLVAPIYRAVLRTYFGARFPAQAVFAIDLLAEGRAKLPWLRKSLFR